jgi:O-succinylbenzoate synthase
MAELEVFSIPVLHQFRGLTVRQGMLIQGEAGIAEWSPFPQYDIPEASQWLLASQEIAHRGYPPPRRSSVVVNSTIPGVDARTAASLAREAECETAKIKVAEHGQTLHDDISRVDAVRDVLGPSAKIRIDANGAWSVDEPRRALKELSRFSLEYVEQPCATVEELAALRKLVDVPIAADESIRRSGDPLRVKKAQAADVVVLKVQPLGGIEACLRLAEDLDMDVVVSSALETSLGLRAGFALAACLPELRYACGLNTRRLLEGDLVTAGFEATKGVVDVCDVRLDTHALEKWKADDESSHWWTSRLAQCEDYLRSKGKGFW